MRILMRGACMLVLVRRPMHVVFAQSAAGFAYVDKCDGIRRA
jgi:hypothetical protein